MLRISLIFLIIASGCATSISSTNLEVAASSIDCNAGVLILTSQDGTYGGNEYAGSGNTVTARIKAELEKRCKNVMKTKDAIEIAYAYAAANGIQLIVEPAILFWEPRATQWSGIPSKLELKITIFSAATKELIDSQLLAAESGSLVWSSSPPEVLLAEVIPVWAEKFSGYRSGEIYNWESHPRDRQTPKTQSSKSENEVPDQ